MLSRVDIASSEWPVSSWHDLYPQSDRSDEFGGEFDERDHGGDPGSDRLHAAAARRPSWILQPHLRRGGGPPGRESIRRPSSKTACRAPPRASSADCTSGSEPARTSWFDAPREPSTTSWSTCAPSSPTYRQWLSFDLDGDSQRSLYIPAGCAHGFQALTEPADTSYRIDREHDPSEDLTIAYDDPELGVPWPLPVTLMSDSDRTARPLSELASDCVDSATDVSLDHCE